MDFFLLTKIGTGIIIFIKKIMKNFLKKIKNLKKELNLFLIRKELRKMQEVFVIGIILIIFIVKILEKNYPSRNLRNGVKNSKSS